MEGNASLLSLHTLDISTWTLMNQGALVVVVDMSLAVLSVVFNLVVITAIREKESLLAVRVNLVLANLCAANLLSAVLVKSISIVHNGYAVAANSTQSEIAFCLLYSFSYRLTWAVLPWTLFLLSWLSLLPRFSRLKAACTARKETPETPGTPVTPACRGGVRAAVHLSSLAGSCQARQQPVTSLAGTSLAGSSLAGTSLARQQTVTSIGQGEPPEPEPPDARFNMLDKAVLGGVWFVSLIYSLLSEQMLGRVADVPCSVSTDPNRGFGLASVVMAILLPALCGPLAAILLHIIISIISVFIKQPPLPKELRTEEMRNLLCILLLSLIFLLTYSLSMVVCELFLPAPPASLLNFIMVKYIAGTSHHLLGPLAIIVSRPDIRRTAVQVYKKGGSTQNKTMEITYEQMQKELGLGVQVN